VNLPMPSRHFKVEELIAIYMDFTGREVSRCHIKLQACSEKEIKPIGPPCYLRDYGPQYGAW
jgi:hypothetical protein